jgi:hypothetical protein
LFLVWIAIYLHLIGANIFAQAFTAWIVAKQTPTSQFLLLSTVSFGKKKGTKVNFGPCLGKTEWIASVGRRMNRWRLLPSGCTGWVPFFSSCSNRMKQACRSPSKGPPTRTLGHPAVGSSRLGLRPL